MTESVEIDTDPVLRVGPAVAYIAVAVRERAHDLPGFNRKGMVLPVARRVDPRYLPCRAIARERMKHCQHGCRPDPGRQKHRRTFAMHQHEAAARCADVETVTGLDVVVK